VPTDYASRLRIPLTGDSTTEFFTSSGMKIAHGYKRVVLGGRGPYVEFSLEQLAVGLLREVEEKHHYYVELRSVFPDNVKVYVQVHPVCYADYVPGLCYVSPFELYDFDGVPLITPLRRDI
jgi:hypothetical protein